MINYGCLHRLVGIVITPNYIFNLQGQKILSFFFFSSLLKSYYMLNSLSVKTKSFPETPLPPRSQQKKKKRLKCLAKHFRSNGKKYFAQYNHELRLNNSNFLLGGIL